jgi:predicted transglutaminase-like cysteine proteinase
LVLGALALTALAAARPLGAQSLAAVLTAPSAPAAPAGAEAGDGLFGTMEFTSASLGALPQWRRILDEMAAEAPAMAACTADPSQCASAASRAWRDLQRAARGQSRMDQLHTVNRFFNRWPYKTDDEAFGRREYWAAPSEFMAGSGDCEDYAIAKYFALRQLGFDKDELRIVVLYDRIRNIGHAVLAVYGGEDILILDSLSDLIAPDTRYRHYIPQYSMNETTRWAHVDHRRAIPQTALRAADN